MLPSGVREGMHEFLCTPRLGDAAHCSTGATTMSQGGLNEATSSADASASPSLEQTSEVHGFAIRRRDDDRLGSTFCDSNELLQSSSIEATPRELTQRLRQQRCRAGYESRVALHYIDEELAKSLYRQKLQAHAQRQRAAHQALIRAHQARDAACGTPHMRRREMMRRTEDSIARAIEDSLPCFNDVTDGERDVASRQLSCRGLYSRGASRIAQRASPRELSLSVVLPSMHSLMSPRYTLTPIPSLRDLKRHLLPHDVLGTASGGAREALGTLPLETLLRCVRRRCSDVAPALNLTRAAISCAPFLPLQPPLTSSPASRPRPMCSNRRPLDRPRALHPSPSQRPHTYTPRVQWVRRPTVDPCPTRPLPSSPI